MRRLAPILLIAALLAGCSSDDGGTTITEPRVPGPTDTLVVFERVGGIAGVRERLDVRPHGAARVTAGGPTLKARRFELNPAELDALRSARDKVDFASLKRSYDSGVPIADGFVTTVMADGRSVKVSTEGDPPDELARLLAVCAGIVTAHAPPP